MKTAKFSQKMNVAPWSTRELRLHQEAVHRLEKILKAATNLVARARFLTEEKLSRFMIERMRNAGITSVLGWTIVAYGPSAADPHYHFKPGHSRQIKPSHFLLLDIWGKLNCPEAPYADITQMYFVGRSAPVRFQKLWAAVRDARDKALAHIQKYRTAYGAKLHGIAKEHLDACGHQGRFVHGLGHDLGHDHPHGPGVNLSPKFPQPLARGRGYTIEPGIYKKGTFGVRSEMDFFLDREGKVRVTTRLQKKLECIA